MKIILTGVLIIIILSPSVCYSQVSNSAQPGSKVALIIGNGSYISSELANPENDARAMKVALQSVGFTVTEFENLNQVQMKKAIDDFGTRLKNSEVGLFFYAGHGIQSKGNNYLIPVDAELKSEEEIELDCVDANRVLAKMEASGSKVNIVILDACRNNPFERSWTRSANGKGLAFMNAPAGTLIGYATSPGSTASDGSGKNGLYTSAILESIQIPGITITQMFQNVGKLVYEKSMKQQTPWISSSMTGDFYFNNKEIIGSGIKDLVKEPILTEIVTNTDKDFFIDTLDNQRYKIIKIGTQVWMAENLRAVKFNDGSSIAWVTDNKEWSDLKTSGYCWYNNEEAPENIRNGALYNWYTVNTGKLCPYGWHVPTDAEWTTLINSLGGMSGVGGKLKESGTANWLNPNTGASNASGFTALPGGYRFKDGSFLEISKYGMWWTATGDGATSAWDRYLYSSSVSITRSSLNKKLGLSVRCIQN
jgi:uncharacterized protein (TIGR02145 family)